MNGKPNRALESSSARHINANVNADSLFVRLFIVILLLGFVTGCARPVGDFGRAAESATHDEILPAIGTWRARASSEPASNFNFTDEENEMHDRVWRYLIAAHSSDWFFDIVTEWQRTRLLPPQDSRFKHDRYYAHLRSEKYRSSKVRYVRVSRDIEADLNMTPSVLKSICSVLEINRRRDEAVRSLRSEGSLEATEVAQRKAENWMFINWFKRALRYRYESYSLALERLLIETPHEGARDIDGLLSVMAIDVERAEQDEFCDGPELEAVEMAGEAMPPKMKRSPFSPAPEFRK